MMRNIRNPCQHKTEAKSLSSHNKESSTINDALDAINLCDNVDTYHMFASCASLCHYSCVHLDVTLIDIVCPT